MATTKKSSDSSASKGKNKIEKVMHEFKEGELHSGGSGKKVTNRKQAVAIALSEARESGAKIPKKAARKIEHPPTGIRHRPMYDVCLNKKITLYP